MLLNDMQSAIYFRRSTPPGQGDACARLLRTPGTLACPTLAR
jgi:hypothetical protein